MGTSGWEIFRIRRRRLSAVNAKEVAHMDQANNAAVRRLIPPTPRSRWLAPSVTTPLYSTTVSKALRQTLRKSFPASSRTYARDSVTTKLSEVCLCPRNRKRISRQGVQVRGSNAYSSRPTPTASQFANRLLRWPVEARLSGAESTSSLPRSLDNVMRC